MKKRLLIVAALIWIIPLYVNAGWEVSKPEATIPREPFFQAASPQTKATFVPKAYGSTAFPNQFASLGQPAPVYAVSVSGSLKENIERILGRYHFKVIWQAPYDYNFDGKVSGASLADVVEKLLKPFPLQAVMYMSNRTITISPRSVTSNIG